MFFLWLASFKIYLRQKFWPRANQTFRNYSVIVLVLYEDQLVHWFWIFWSKQRRYETYENYKFAEFRQFLWFLSFLNNTLLYIFLHCDWTKQDRETCEPILERRRTQVSPWIKKWGIRVITTIQKCSNQEPKWNFDKENRSFSYVSYLHFSDQNTQNQWTNWSLYNANTITE